MNTDEKNKFSSNSKEFDPDMREDRYDEIKRDKEYQHSDKRNKNYLYDQTPDSYGKNVIKHDPYNVRNKDIDRKNRKINKPTDMDGWDINREEQPTNRDLHRTKEDIPHKNIHHKEVKESFVTKDKSIEYRNEKIKEKRAQYPEIHNPLDKSHAKRITHK